jgi:hypothetical protein
VDSERLSAAAEVVANAKLASRREQVIAVPRLGRRRPASHGGSLASCCVVDFFVRFSTAWLIRVRYENRDLSMGGIACEVLDPPGSLIAG